MPSNRKASAKRKSSKAKSSRGGRGRSRRGLFGVLGRLFYWCFVLAIWGGIAVAGVVVYYGAKMPAATTWSIPDRAPNIKIVSVDGQLLANRGMSGGEAVGLHEMSPYIPEAVIAIEDRRFYSHFGVDPIGLSRAMVTNLLGGHFSQGGSTLTQQLAKNLFLKPDRTLERKVQEVLLALWLEHKHTKDQILEMYLNRVYFGSGAYGVEAASRRYFGKSARDVTLSEAALLAGLLKAPSRLSPARDPKAAEERSPGVSPPCATRVQPRLTWTKTALSAPATRSPSYWTGSENYVADTIMEELPDLIGDVRGDIVIDCFPDLITAVESLSATALDKEAQEAQRHPGCTGVDRRFRRGARHGRRLRLFDQPVRPRLGSASPAGLGLQAVRLCGGPRSRLHARARCATTRRSGSATGHPTITAESTLARSPWRRRWPSR